MARPLMAGGFHCNSLHRTGRNNLTKQQWSQGLEGHMEKGKYNIYMELGKDMSNNGRSGVGAS
ncbi:MAG TPA: hypothetical protein VFD60_12705 [Nitrososphaeraceae archaeon]|nr:hypothetical protein [Nitrososphaeraceae archaeon]